MAIIKEPAPPNIPYKEPSSFWVVDVFSKDGDLEWRNAYKDHVGRDCWRLALKEALKKHSDIEWDIINVAHRPRGGWGEMFQLHAPFPSEVEV